LRSLKNKCVYFASNHNDINYLTRRRYSYTFLKNITLVDGKSSRSNGEITIQFIVTSSIRAIALPCFDIFIPLRLTNSTSNKALDEPLIYVDGCKCQFFPRNYKLDGCWNDVAIFCEEKAREIKRRMCNQRILNCEPICIFPEPPQSPGAHGFRPIVLQEFRWATLSERANHNKVHSKLRKDPDLQYNFLIPYCRRCELLEINRLLHPDLRYNMAINSSFLIEGKRRSPR